MKTVLTVRKSKQGKNFKKIFKRINIKFFLTKRKNQKCIKLRKRIIFKQLEVTGKILKRRITNADC